MPLINKLPGFWVAPELPPIYEIAKPEDHTYTVVGQDEKFDSPMEAYRFITENLHGRARFTAEIFADYAESWDEEGEEAGMGGYGDFYSVPIDVNGETMYELYISHSPNDEYLRALDEYAEFQGLLRAYEADPDDFYNAYEFLRTHPYFWHRYGEETKLAGWVYGLDPDDLHLSVYKDDEGQVNFLIETGPYVNRGGEHSLDMRLTKVASSYNEAVIATAALLHSLVDETGEERA